MLNQIKALKKFTLDKYRKHLDAFPCIKFVDFFWLDLESRSTITKNKTKKKKTLREKTKSLIVLIKKNFLFKTKAIFFSFGLLIFFSVYYL